MTTTHQPPHATTHIALLLDRSGSMQSLRREALDIVNEQVRTIRAQADDQDVRVSLVTFSTVADAPVLWDEPAATLAPLAPQDYRPAGMTAMLDAFGRTIDGLRALPDADEPTTAFLVVVISDGRENNSKHHTWEGVAERVQACEATGRWTFVYHGADHDLADVQRALRLDRANVRRFQRSKEGLAGTGRALSKRHTRFLDARKRGLTRADPPSPTEDDEGSRS